MIPRDSLVTEIEKGSNLVHTTEYGASSYGTLTYEQWCEKEMARINALPGHQVRIAAEGPAGQEEIALVVDLRSSQL